jgi:thiamine kinase-like enzyme
MATQAVHLPVGWPVHLVHPATGVFFPEMMAAETRVRGLAFWRGIRSIVPLKGGVSNAAFVVDDLQGRFVARVGEDYPFHQVSRAREAEAHRAAHDVGVSPELLYARDGVMIVQYVTAKTYVETDVQRDWQRCLELVARSHRDVGSRIRGQGAIFWVFQILRDYAETLRKANHRQAPNLLQWVAIVDELEKVQVPLPIVFGHHDLLPSNFMEDDRRVWLIDWEYGAFGTAMFDLANLAAANSFDAVREHEMLLAYFGKAPDHSRLRAYFAMKVAAALREAMWGMISELYLAASGIDYIAYAAEYIGRFDTILTSYRKDFP